MNRAKCAPRLTSLLAVLLGLFVFQTTTYANTSNEMTDPSPTSANVSDQPTATVDGPSVSATSDVETDQPVNDPAATSASTTETDYSADDASTDSGDSTTQPSDSESKDNQPAVDDVQASKQAENNPQPTVENGTASPNSTASQQPETTTSDNNASQKTATPSANDRITIDDANNPDNPAWKQSSNNPLINFITGITSTIAAGVVYPFAASRQGAALLSKIRTLMSPDRYNVDQMWSDLDSKYDPAFTKSYYTDAKNWYDNEVTRQMLSVPFADGTGNASATYIAHPNSTKTIIYGQGWTTEPEWMGYISKVFYDMGYNVLMPYTRGQSTSDGEFLTFGAKDKADWLNWINKINDLNGPTSKVVLYGQSLGADSALQTAAQSNLPSSVKAVIADCGFSTIPSLLFSLYTGASNSLNNLTSKIGWNLNGTIPLVPFDQFLNGFNNINKLLQGFSLDAVSGVTAVENSKLPTMFIATADDTFIPDTQTETLYNLSASTLKQLWILDGNVGGHASANNAVKDYTARIQAFLNQVDAQNSDTKLNITDDQHVAA